MNLVNKLREVYGWTPSYHLDSKKRDQKGSNWLILSYHESKPICLWVSGSTVKTLHCGIDERLCGDTIFQADCINGTYIIRDLFMLNSCNLTSSTKTQRLGRIAGLMHFVYNIAGLDQIVFRSGTGITRTELPDVYFIEGTEQYIQVPDIQTSEYLRSLGESFELELEERDGLWFVKYPCLK